MKYLTNLEHLDPIDLSVGYPILLVLFVPLVLGAALLLLRPLREGRAARKTFTAAALAVDLLLVYLLLRQPDAKPAALFWLTPDLPIVVHQDLLSRAFLAMAAALWLAAGIFSFGYFKGDRREGLFYGVYLMVFGMLAGVAVSGNLISLYLFYELLTLTSSLLVFYEGTHEAVMAGLKYLFYSIGGAFLALIGIFVLARMNGWLVFQPGGLTLHENIAGRTPVILAVAFLMLLGVGAKAGMYPLHGWLPTAHPVAPAPASAVLSGLIVKAGVFFAIRLVYYTIGADLLRGTWVQYAWLTLALVTVFMGSMLAFMEPVLKKRLAYSTVSQVSYILFGLALLTPTGLTGGLLHMIFHAVTKCGLFLAAGAFIKQSKCTRVDGLEGVGRAMPVTTACFAMFGLSLVGIPPFSGFVSKWYLATGVSGAGVGLFALIGPAVLLLSALLTAGYLFPLPVRGFFAPAKKGVREAPPVMTVPLAALAVLSLVLGIFAQPLAGLLAQIAGSVL